MIVLSEHDVRELLDMESCVEAMAEVLAALARGELFNAASFDRAAGRAPTRSSVSCRPTGIAPRPCRP